MYVEHLLLHNLRCFREPPPIDFCHPDRKAEDPKALRNVTLLLGDNGAGKTTILKALALVTLAPVIESSGYVPYRLIRRGPEGNSDSAIITGGAILHAQDLGSEKDGTEEYTAFRTLIRRRGDYEVIAMRASRNERIERMFDDRSPAFLVVGYGATRRVEAADRFDMAAQTKRRALRYLRVAGLFEDHVALTPLSAWLPRLRDENPGRFEQVEWLLNELLDGHARFTGDIEDGDYVFEHRGARVPFPALSDGYRAYIGWIADLLHHICMGCPSDKALDENSGLVLVDEIDLHLHPSWQRTVVPTLSRVLPRLQFVFSTHSPLVAGTLRAENILVMEQADDGAMIARRYEERIHGLNADQVLTSSYFGLHTTRAPGAEDELVELSKRARGGDDEAALAFMRKLVGDEAAAPTEAPPRTRPKRRPATKKSAPKKSAPKKSLPKKSLPKKSSRPAKTSPKKGRVGR